MSEVDRKTVAATSESADDRIQRLLEQAEADLAAGDINASTDALADIATALSRVEDRPRLLSRAMWLVGLVSLTQGRVDDFARNSAAAVDGLERADAVFDADVARRARAEILDRLQDDIAVRETGALGFLEVLDRQAQRIVDRARDEAPWDQVDRDRQQLGELAALASDAEGGLLPLARLLRALELGPIDAVIIALLIPLASSPTLMEQAQQVAGESIGGSGLSAESIAKLCFTDVAARALVIDRLAPGSPLVRYRVVRVCSEGAPTNRRIALEADLLWFLRDTPITGLPLRRAVTIHRFAADELAVASSLNAVAATLTGAFSAPLVVPIVLEGRRGAGKTTLTLAAAAKAARAVIIVDADSLSDEELSRIAPTVIRDGFIHGAVLYLRCHRALPAHGLDMMLAEGGLRLVVGTTEALGATARERVRCLRADAAVVRVPGVREIHQVAAWQLALAAHGEQAPASDEIAARLVRGGLAIGDIVETVTEEVASAVVGGYPVTVPGLEARLFDRLRGELEALAEVLDAEALTAGLEPDRAAALDALVEQVPSGRSPVDSWVMGVEPAHAREYAVVRINASSERQVAAAAARMALRLRASLCRLRVGDLPLAEPGRACTHLRALFAAAERAGAVVVLAGADALAKVNPGAIPNLLQTLLADPGTTVIVGSRPEVELPLPIECRIRYSLTLDPVELSG